jgi:hypothetical protein
MDPHTDDNFLYGWGGSDGWLTGANGKGELTREQLKHSIVQEEGGMLIVSSYAACKGWNGYSKENLVKVVTLNQLIYQKWKNF